MCETAIAVTFLHDGQTEIANGFPVKILATSTQGTGYEVGSMSIVKGAKNLEQAKKFYEWALTAQAQQFGAAGDIPGGVDRHHLGPRLAAELAVVSRGSGGAVDAAWAPESCHWPAARPGGSARAAGYSSGLTSGSSARQVLEQLPPDEAGAVLIGYAMYEQFEGHGYATEVVRAMIGSPRKSVTSVL